MMCRMRSGFGRGRGGLRQFDKNAAHFYRIQIAKFKEQSSKSLVTSPEGMSPEERERLENFKFIILKNMAQPIFEIINLKLL